MVFRQGEENVAFRKLWAALEAGKSRKRPYILATRKQKSGTEQEKTTIA